MVNGGEDQLPTRTAEFKSTEKLGREQIIIRITVLRDRQKERVQPALRVSLKKVRVLSQASLAAAAS